MPPTGSIPFIPFARPSIGEQEVSAAAEVIRSGWLTTGPKASEFEAKFAEFLGCEYAVAVNSATAGLHLGLEALGVGAGDTVLTTPFTFTATAEVIRYLGADVLFADIDPVTFNIDPECVDSALRKHAVKAIIPVHYGGQPCDMSEIIALAKKHRCAVMCDAAHAFPAKYRGQFVGALEDDVSVFSFYANKTICTGEGGMAVTRHSDIAKRMKLMRLHGIDRDAFQRYRSTTPGWFYEVIAPGFKYNMPDISAAIGLEQLEKADGFRQARERIADYYREAFQSCSLRLPEKKRNDDQHAWHLYVIRLQLDKLRIDRDQFIDALSALGIGTSVHYIPLHMQPYWRDRYRLTDNDFPVATRMFREVISLPIYPGLSDEELERIVEAVTTLLSRYEF